MQVDNTHRWSMSTVHHNAHLPPHHRHFAMSVETFHSIHTEGLTNRIRGQCWCFLSCYISRL